MVAILTILDVDIKMLFVQCWVIRHLTMPAEAGVVLYRAHSAACGNFPNP